MDESRTEVNTQEVLGKYSAPCAVLCNRREGRWAGTVSLQHVYTVEEARDPEEQDLRTAHLHEGLPAVTAPGPGRCVREGLQAAIRERGF